MRLSDTGFTALIPLHEVAPEEMFRVENFRSLSSELDDYLRNGALDHRTEHLSTTSVIFHEDFDGLVGFITLANDGIKLDVTEINHLGLNCDTQISTFPAVKICRLAVHEDLRGNKIGSRILDLAIGEIVGASGISAARIMITDAVNVPKVIDFYTDYGFLESVWAQGQLKQQKRGTVAVTIKMIRDIYA